MAIRAVPVLLFTLAVVAQGAAECVDQTTCADVSEGDTVQASALLQKDAAVGKHREVASSKMQSLAQLKKSQMCTNVDLQLAHVQALRRNGALHASGGRVGAALSTRVAETAAQAPAEAEGATALLDAAGFRATSALCCPEQMEVFFNRLLDSMGMKGCSVPHVQGLMHWFSCVPDMDFEYMRGVIKDGNPCKYWAPKDQACPVLSKECAGEWCR